MAAANSACQRRSWRPRRRRPLPPSRRPRPPAWRPSWCDPCSCPVSKAKETITGSPVRLAAASAMRASSDVAHGLDQQRVRAAVGQRRGLFVEGREHLLRGDLARQQHLAGGAHGGEHERRACRRPAAKWPRPARLMASRSPSHRRCRVGAERIGEDHLAAGLDVGARHRFDAVSGSLQIPGIGHSPERAGRAPATRVPQAPSVRSAGLRPASSARRFTDRHQSPRQRHRRHRIFAVAIGADLSANCCVTGAPPTMTFTCVAHSRRSAARRWWSSWKAWSR